MDILKEVLKAEQRIRRYIKETPLEYSLALGQMTGCQVFVKLENLQHTGSFKARGATAAVDAHGHRGLQSLAVLAGGVAVKRPLSECSRRGTTERQSDRRTGSLVRTRFNQKVKKSRL